MEFVNGKKSRFRKYKKARCFKNMRRGKEIFCPICGESCGCGMGSGRIYMLHHTIGCEAAKRY